MRSPILRRALPLVLLLVGVLLALSLSPDAAARVGGGQGFSGGGGSSSGGRGSGGGGGGGDLIYFLVWLLLEHPAVGVPVLLVVVGVVFAKQFMDKGGGDQRWHSGEPSPVVMQSPRKPAVDLRALRAVDPGFSEPLLLDYVQLAYARVQELRPRPDPALLQTLLSERALKQVAARSVGVNEVRDVIFGSTRLASLDVGRQWTRLVVEYQTNLTEVTGAGPRQLLNLERWTFQRVTGAPSPGPDIMRSLGCASCGSTLEAQSDGRCPNCDSLRVGGQLQWEVVQADVISSRPLSRPELHLGGGVEPGTRSPTVKDPHLGAQQRAFDARHPDFDGAAFQQRVAFIFTELQAAWSEGSWERARPYQTDPLFQVHRFWIERYARLGLANRLADVTVLKIELARVDTDAWFEALTLRVFARMRDWTEEVDGGKVVGGSKTEPRTFSEYWTFIRAVGAEDRGKGPRDGHHCPSCGAPLDRVGMAGVCGYCDSKITGGDFDWVLSRIEQDDTYGR